MLQGKLFLPAAGAARKKGGSPATDAPVGLEELCMKQAEELLRKGAEVRVLKEQVEELCLTL